jgi:hypothetical protein
MELEALSRERDILCESSNSTRAWSASEDMFCNKGRIGPVGVEEREKAFEKEEEFEALTTRSVSSG